jgi:two-component system, chemotaxis family, sensor kinase CheA
MKIDLTRFRVAFFQEAAEHLDKMEAALLALESGPKDPEQLNAIFRAAHSIKGASGTFGFEDVTRFTHALEDLLDRMRRGEVEPSAERIELLLRACDMLRTILAAAETNGPAPNEMEPLLAAITVAQRSGDFAPEGPHQVRRADQDASGPRQYRVHFRPSPATFRDGMDPLLIVRELYELGSVTAMAADVTEIPEFDRLQPDVCYLAWTLELTSDRAPQEIRDVFAFVEDEADIAIDAIDAVDSEPTAATSGSAPRIAGEQKRSRDSGSIRVATEKVDQLINVVGELLIVQSMAEEIAAHFSSDRLAELQAALTEVARNTRELQERVMSIRMLPVGTVFARLPRIVHDIASAAGKSVRLDLSGEDAELDKTILEGIVDPLTHLVRNAADHGIESPQERCAAGKPEQGVITLRARHESGNFLIEVTDDGRGLNVERIREKAVERGLLPADEKPTDEQVQALVFQAGFSTAETVTDVSGRGVGMDVVRKNVEALGGAVTLKSHEGEGTTVTIKLPLTLAILEGQLVRVGSETYVLPLVSIVESVKPTKQQAHRVVAHGEVVVVRREPVPLLRLHELFRVATDVVDPCSGLVAIVEHEGSRLALLVDELLGQQQVVIKNLQTHFRKVEGAMGATILGDGRVSLILDVAGLVELSRRAVPAGPAAS